MKKVIIADITTLTDNGKIYGHFAKVAQQYYEILSKRFEVKIAGGITYEQYFRFDLCIELPYYISFKDNYSGIKTKFSRKIKEFANAWKALHSKSADIVIFQCLNETAIYLCLLFPTRPKVCMIQYQKGLNHKWKKILFHMIKKKIQGYIVSSDVTAHFYGGNSVILPDYFPLGIPFCGKRPLRYDAVVLGTINEWKDYNDVIDSFSKTSYRVAIAGKFKDDNHYKKLVERKSANIEIYNKYLSEEEYYNFLLSAKYVLLPYTKDYVDKSSGVLLEALYAGKPVIAPNLNTFNCAIVNQCGLFYKDSIQELVSEIGDDRIYEFLKKQTMAFIDSMKLKSEELIQFVDSM